jgi:hypothetical protein
MTDDVKGEAGLVIPAQHKTLFSVIQTTDAEGHSFCQVDWHPDLYEVVDAQTPEGVLTDRLIDLAEELLTDAKSMNEDCDCEPWPDKCPYCGKEPSNGSPDHQSDVSASEAAIVPERYKAGRG